MVPIRNQQVAGSNPTGGSNLRFSSRPARTDVPIREDFARLASLLKGIRGRFILSLNDDAHIRQEFAAFSIQKVTGVYTVGTIGKDHGPVAAHELVITN